MKLNLTPNGEAMVTLVALGEAEDQARERISAVELEARQASTELAEAREALVELEAGSPTAPERKQAETRLSRAEEAAKQPWPQRVEGAQRAAREAHHALQRYAAEHLADLVAEIEETGAAVAEHVNACAEAFIEAVDRRAQVEATLTQVVALTRMMSPNDISRAQSDEARQSVQRFLAGGGEDAPIVRIELPEAPEAVPAA